MKTIQEMARDAGLSYGPKYRYDLETFVALVRKEAIADEREKCAQLCETLTSICYDTAGYTDCAAAIRARSEK